MLKLFYVPHVEEVSHIILSQFPLLNFPIVHRLRRSSWSGGFMHVKFWPSVLLFNRKFVTSCTGKLTIAHSALVPELFYLKFNLEKQIFKQMKNLISCERSKCIQDGIKHEDKWSVGNLSIWLQLARLLSELLTWLAFNDLRMNHNQFPLQGWSILVSHWRV